jgi:hypothetical protein
VEKAVPSPKAPDAKAEQKAKDSDLAEATLTLADGTTVTGLLVERDNRRAVVRIEGIDVEYRSDEFQKVDVLAPVEVRYREFRATIADNDKDRLVILAQWLFDRERYALARAELQHVLALEPGFPPARDLLLLTEEQAKLAANAGKAKGKEKPDPNKPKEPRFPLLNADQINLIKVFEVDLNDPPRMTVRRDTRQRLIRKYTDVPPMPETQEGREAVLRGSDAEFLKLMFALRAREFYGEVEIEELPESMRKFRERVLGTWLTNSCATTRCHGGSDAGRLYLYHSSRKFSDPSVFTNFLILERFKLADGASLINYDEPARSPLLEMGLPSAVSNRPHPAVPGGRSGGYKPAFRDRDDPRYLEAVDWIRSMFRPRPEYGIKYEPPRPSEPPAEVATDGKAAPGPGR